MLQRVQPERGDGGGLGVPKNTKDPAFLAESIVPVAQVPRTAQLVFVFEPLSHGHLPLVPLTPDEGTLSLTQACARDQLARTCQVTEI
jgi:hydroxypyruvate isomerase